MIALVSNSDQTPPFDQMVSGLFSTSNPDQKAGLINQILAGLGPGGLSSGLAGGFLMGLLGCKPEGGLIYTIFVAFVGAVILTWVYRKVTAGKA